MSVVRWTPKQCPDCGQEFLSYGCTQVYCRRCRRKRKMARAAVRRAEREAAGIKAPAVANSNSASAPAPAPEPAPAPDAYLWPTGPVPMRACHDCKKPTRDFRCPACRLKWGKKNGLVMDDRALPMYEGRVA